MPRRPITNQMYDKLLESFRAYPGEYARAARAAGCDPRTAARGWRLGWVKQNKAWAAISAVIEQEQLSARARVQEATAAEADRARTAIAIDEAADRDKAKADAIEARGQEAQMVRLLRADVTQTLASVARTLPGMQKWATAVAKQMNERDPNDIREATRMLEALSRVTERVAAAADRCMAMERRLLGQPEQVVGLALPEITLDEAIEHIGAAERAAKYLRAEGAMPALPTGNGGLPAAQAIIDVAGGELSVAEVTEQDARELPDIEYPH